MDGLGGEGGRVMRFGGGREGVWFFFRSRFCRVVGGWVSRLPGRGEHGQPRGPVFLRLIVGHAARLFPASPGT